MTAEEFRSHWQGFNERWLAFCYANRLTPGVDRPRDNYMAFSLFVTSRIVDGHPGVERGTIVDQEQFSELIWAEAQAQRGESNEY